MGGSRIPSRVHESTKRGVNPIRGGVNLSIFYHYHHERLSDGSGRKKLRNRLKGIHLQFVSTYLTGPFVMIIKTKFHCVSCTTLLQVVA